MNPIADTKTPPKVFISYSWLKKDRAVQLAEQLYRDGIYVVMDEYDLKPGDDRFKFMESSVNDPTISFVLLLTDESYCEKANNRKGGVGIETSIITPEVYESTDSSKFIPVALEVDEQGSPYLPTFLKSRFCIILTKGFHDNAEYRKLVSHLWGEPISPRPAIGVRPRWLDLPRLDTHKIDAFARSLGREESRSLTAQSSLLRSAGEVAALLNDVYRQVSDKTPLADAIALTESVRNAYLEAVESLLQSGLLSGERLALSIEKIHEDIALDGCKHSAIISEAMSFFMWELFIYITAQLLEYRSFKELRTLLQHTYFLRDIIGTRNTSKPKYYRDIYPKLDFITSRYGEKTQCGEAKPNIREIAKSRISYPGLTFDSLVSADLFLSHYDTSMPHDQNEWWYRAALLAGYGHNTDRHAFWKRLVSRATATEIMPLFEVKSIDELKSMISEMRSTWKECSASHCGLEFGGIEGINIEPEDIATRP